MKIALIGAGGIANFLAHPLALSLSSSDSLTVIDGDIFEEKNAGRQPFCEPGQPKARVLADRMSVGKAYISFNAEYVTAHDDLEEYDVLISCVEDRKSVV